MGTDASIDWEDMDEEKDADDSDGQTAYHIYAYHDSHCTKEDSKETSSIRDSFKATGIPGCFNIFQGALKDFSMRLSCPSPTSDGDKVIVRTLHDGRNCKGTLLKKRMMKWSFFDGQCQHKERLRPALQLSDYPSCKKDMPVAEAPSITMDPLSASATKPLRSLRHNKTTKAK